MGPLGQVNPMLILSEHMSIRAMLIPPVLQEGVICINVCCDYTKSSKDEIVLNIWFNTTILLNIYLVHCFNIIQQKIALSL